MLKTFAFLILLFAASGSFAQKKFVISGTIKDEPTGEQLIGASTC